MPRKFLTLFGHLLSVAIFPLAHLQAAPPRDPAETYPIPSFTLPPARADGHYLRFAVIGDWGTGRADQIEVARAMHDRLAAEPVNFILTVGDNFYEYGVKSISDPQWKTKFEDIYLTDEFQVPWYATLGNHDHRGNVVAQVDYSFTSKRWRMPAQFYTFTQTLPDGTVIAFFALDTDPIKRDTPASIIQIAWLNQELGASQARWKIVFGHHPVFSSSTAHGDEPNMIREVRPLLERHRVDVYFAGHDHTLEMLEPVGGVNYVITGGGAGEDMAYGIEWTRRSRYAATGGGFTAVRVSADEMVIEFVRSDGKTQYAEVIVK